MLDVQRVSELSKKMIDLLKLKSFPVIVFH